MEIWKDIDGYDGLYKISNFGRVKSLAPNLRFQRGQPREMIMKLACSSSGYSHVQLYKNGKSSTKLVHILVAKAFLRNDDNKPQVNHKDCNKLNNHVDNLEWVTKSENILHACKNGLIKSPTKGKFGTLNCRSRSVNQYDLSGNLIKTWDCISVAAREIGCRSTSINECLAGRNKTCKGFVWKYPE